MNKTVTLINTILNGKMLRNVKCQSVSQCQSVKVEVQVKQSGFTEPEKIKFETVKCLSVL